MIYKRICMKERTVIRKQAGQRGVSLYELLLTLAISGAIVLGLFKSLDDFKNDAQDELMARHMMTIHTAAQNYVIRNFDSLWQDAFGQDPNDLTDIQNQNAIIHIPIYDEGGVAPNNWFLTDPVDDVLPPTYPNTTLVNRQPIRVYVRNASVDPNTNERTLEVLTGSFANTPAQLIPERRLRSIAQKMGIQGGYLSGIDETGGPAIANPCTDAGGTAQGSYGTFSIPVGGVGGFNDTVIPGYNIYCGLTAPIAGQGGYVLAYSRVTLESATNDLYLYRTAVTGEPDANRMEANLDMNGFNIDNIRYVTADSVEVAGNMTMTDTLGGGIIPAGNQFTVDEIMTVNGGGSLVTGDITVAGRNIPGLGGEAVEATSLSLPPAGVLPPVGPPVAAQLVAGNVELNNMIVGRDMYVSNRMDTGAIGPVATMSVATTHVRGTAYSSNGLILGAMNNNTATMTATNLTTSSLDVGGDLNATGDVNIVAVGSNASPVATSTVAGGLVDASLLDISGPLNACSALIRLTLDGTGLNNLTHAPPAQDCR